MARIAPLARKLQALCERGAIVYRPIVEDLIQGGSTDINLIERTLDSLLDFCAHHEALQLYRRLCRHLWDIDQVAAASYVLHYRERYEEAAEETFPSGEELRAHPNDGARKDQP